jgi:hypothetical protein
MRLIIKEGYIGCKDELNAISFISLSWNQLTMSGIDANDSEKPSAKRFRLESSEGSIPVVGARRKTVQHGVAISPSIEGITNNKGGINNINENSTDMEDSNDLDNSSENNNTSNSNAPHFSSNLNSTESVLSPELHNSSVSSSKTPILSREMSAHAGNGSLPATSLNTPMNIGPRSSVYGSQIPQMQQILGVYNQNNSNNTSNGYNYLKVSTSNNNPSSLPSSSVSPFAPSCISKPEPIAFNRLTVQYHEQAVIPEYAIISNNLRRALELRRKFLFQPARDQTLYDMNDEPVFQHPDPSKIPPSTAQKHQYKYVDGVYIAWKGGAETDYKGENVTVYQAPARADYAAALQLLMDLASDGPVKSFCHNRLHLLEARFNLHELLNHDLETTAQKAVPHRDFYNVRKIDNHVHHSAVRYHPHSNSSLSSLSKPS